MRNACVAAAILTATSTAAIQQPPERQAITSTATAILVDAVVRDRNGKPLIDLSASDFEVFEDGIRQTVDSFTRVSNGAGIGIGVAWRVPDHTVAVNPTARPEDAAAAPNEDTATVALVYDHLSSEALSLAQKATLAYVPLTGESPVRVGVFAGEPGPRVLQYYTTERAAVRRAVAQLTPAGTSVGEQKAERADNLIARRRDIDDENARTMASTATATGAELARNGAEIGARETERALIQIELNMMRSFDSLERAHKGFDTATVLTTVIRSLSVYPGRKTIIFFSEGLPVTPTLSSRLDAVIDAANRANITAYAIDAKGLRAISSLADARKEMAIFVEDRTRQTANGDRTIQPLTMAFERVEDTMRLDSRTGLAKLAEETGGFLVDQSNDLASAFRRIDEDNRFHYLLSYSPTNTTFDGRFRAIKVGVRRPGAQVFARKGYRALRTAPAADTGDYQAAALALLDRAPLPNAFPIHAGAFSFPDPARPGLSPIAVNVATESLQFVVDASRAPYSAQTSVVVRIRDGDGNQVQTLSQQYLLTGDAKDVAAAKNGQILFYREADLAPGVYTVESIVVDAAARRASARMATLTVPRVTDAGLGMSSLVLVSRSEELMGAANGESPLRVGKTLLYPILGETIVNAPQRELPFFFTLYGNAAGVTAAAQLLRNGTMLAEAPVPLPQSSGPRVQHVGRFPIGTLPMGTYELRLKVGDLSRSAFFTLRNR
jgi:VWFA-related protein